MLRYHEYCDHLREHLTVDLSAGRVSLYFGMPMPKSWSKKKREKMLGKPHRQRPDIDNLIKGVLDALMIEDKSIWGVTAVKFWLNKGCVSISVPRHT